MKWNALVYLKQMMKYNSKDSKQNLLPKYSRHKKVEQLKKEDQQAPTDDKIEEPLNKDSEKVPTEKTEENKGIELWFRINKVNSFIRELVFVYQL